MLEEARIEEGGWEGEEEADRGTRDEVWAHEVRGALKQAARSFASAFCDPKLARRVLGGY